MVKRHREKKRIGYSLVNLSRIIWATGVCEKNKDQSVFVVQDYAPEDVISDTDKDYFIICCGDNVMDDALRPCYLAVITPDGRYTMEPIEKYLEDRDIGRDTTRILDALNLPDQMNNLSFCKVVLTNFTYPYSELRGFTRHCSGGFYQKSGSTLWELCSDEKCR